MLDLCVSGVSDGVLMWKFCGGFLLWCEVVVFCVFLREKNVVGVVDDVERVVERGDEGDKMMLVVYFSVVYGWGCGGDMYDIVCVIYVIF